MKPIGFIYLTTNLVNGKIYIGQHQFNYDNANYIGSGTLFSKAVRKYGKENFKRKILRVCKTKHELSVWEHVFIIKYKSYDKKIGYNIALGDVNTSECNPAKIPSVRKKMSDFAKKRFSVPENNPMFGKHFSKETKKKMSIAQKGEKSWMWGKKGELCHNYGRKLSDEQKKKLSEKLSGKNNPNYGKHWSKEVKRKISQHHADVRGENNPMFGKRGEKSPMYNRVWINDGKFEKFINIDLGIPEGFKIGRIAKRNHKNINKYKEL